MRWTPDVIERLRELAADGMSLGQAAGEFGVPYTTVAKVASVHIIRFRPKRKGMRPKAGAPWKHALARAQDSLRAEIEAAKREAPTAPLYRGGSWA